MNNTAVKISELTYALTQIPETELDSVMAYVSSILAESQMPKLENRSLKGIWAGPGFETIIDLEAEIRLVRCELQDSIGKRML
ncbi:MAG: hypothetical protein KJZ86_24320 [Caldilineaceae bacterium]|mgnify:CR=1 FL=1|nr:hypothetical protein [Caldilineaceae bacterium]